MIRSMTAFARVSDASKKSQWVMEFRSLNNRYLDVSLKMPPALSSYELEIREQIQAQIRRGKVTVNIYQENAEDESQPQLALNEALLNEYVKAARKLQKQHGLKGEISAMEILRMPGLIEFKRESEHPEKTWQHIKKLVKKGLEAAKDARRVEGKKLYADLDKRLGLIAQTVGKIEAQSQGRSELIARKLGERLDAIIQENQMERDERFYREVAYLAEKCDITEEIVRLKSHLELFRDKLASDGEVGRELDFLCQELNREINTIGSKSQLFEIATEVIFVKGELEKIREQIQNIE